VPSERLSLALVVELMIAECPDSISSTSQLATSRTTKELEAQIAALCANSFSQHYYWAVKVKLLQTGQLYTTNSVMRRAWQLIRKAEHIEGKRPNAWTAGKVSYCYSSTKAGVE
jgi:hypothetical protein